MSNVYNIFTGELVIESSQSAFERAVEHYITRFGSKRKLPKHYRDYLKKSEPVSEPYGFGCVHNIAYRTVETSTWNEPYPFALNLDPSTAHVGKGVKLGDQADPCAWMDVRYGMTLEWLKGKNKGDTVTIETRSDLIAHDDYANELVRIGSNVTVIVYLCPAPESVARQLEPGAPSNKRRLAAIDKLRGLGVNVVVESIDSALKMGARKNG